MADKEHDASELEEEEDGDELHGPGRTFKEEGGGQLGAMATKPGDHARKTWRACDLCRKRKQRCNGFEMADGRCTVCINSNQQCTYVEDSKKRAPPKGYVESLETRCQKAEELLIELVPNFDIVRTLGPPLEKDTFSRTNKKGPAPKSKEEKAAAKLVKAETLEHADGLGSPNHDPQYMPRSASHFSDASGRAMQPHHRPQQSAIPTSSSSPFYLPFGPHAYPHPPSCLPPTGQPQLHPHASQSYQSRVQYESNVNALSGRAYSDVVALQAGKEREEEEANLIGFVQLAHRDEQLFKRFMGLSSGLPLMYSALGFKYGATPNKFHLELKAHRSTSRSRFWRIPPWESTPTCFSSTADPSAPAAVTRTPSGQPPCPQLAAMRDQNPFASWPASSLAWKLIGAYFDRVNALIPLLHRPTFESRYNSQIYNSDPGFARICLLLFAVASPYVDDERVLFPKEDGTTYGVDSAGWIYWHGFGRMVRHRLAPTELCDLQVAVLLVQFLRNSSQPGSCWLLCGEGLRYAQDIAVHRKRAKRSSDPVENEEFRRAFWCLYALEREWSGFLGRPFLLAEDDFDVELPHECDDEYWQTGDPATDFVQPADHQPSRLTAFILTLQLQKILSTILKELYNTQRGRGRSPADIVQALEQELQEWLNVLPPHLQWDPNQQDDLWFRQAVDLHLQYNIVLTYLHRPFLPSPRKPTTSFPRSYNACIAAAHAIASILHCHWLRTRENYLHVFNVAYTAALVLLVGFWCSQGSDAQAALASLVKLEAAMSEGEKVFFGIGRARDAVTVLSAPRAEPPPQPPNLSAKRKASTEHVPDAESSAGWESRRQPPPGQHPSSRGLSLASNVPPGARYQPPPPGAAYAPQAYPFARSASRTGGEWGLSPRTPGFANSPSTSQGAGSENDSLQLGLFDWDAGFSDPTMTLFPGRSGEDAWQQQQPNNGERQATYPPRQQQVPPGYATGYPPQAGQPFQLPPRYPPPLPPPDAAYVPSERRQPLQDYPPAFHPSYAPQQP